MYPSISLSLTKCRAFAFTRFTRNFVDLAAIYSSGQRPLLRKCSAVSITEPRSLGARQMHIHVQVDPDSPKENTDVSFRRHFNTSDIHFLNSILIFQRKQQT